MSDNSYTKGKWSIMAGAPWNILCEGGARIVWCRSEDTRNGEPADIANARHIVDLHNAAEIAISDIHAVVKERDTAKKRIAELEATIRWHISDDVDEAIATMKRNTTAGDYYAPAPAQPPMAPCAECGFPENCHAKNPVTAHRYVAEAVIYQTRVIVNEFTHCTIV